MFMGNDGFVWFQGVVEDRLDPLKIGRVRVRMLGHHPHRKSSDQGMRTEDLLWCHPMQTIADGAMNGIGQSALGVVEGTWVFGFFRDAHLRQDPVIIGTVPGIPGELPNTSLGFNDPNGQYPKEEYLNEPDMNRLSRNDVDPEEYDEATSVQEFEDGTAPYVKRPHDIIQLKRDAERKEIPTAGFDEDGPVYDEPVTPYAAEYPFNHVNESESGHVTEVDDTPGQERLHKYHRTGTFEEIHPDGSKVTKVVGDDFAIVVQDRNVLIEGNLNITVVGDSTFYCQQNVTQQIDGDLKQHVKGNVDQHVEMNVTQVVDQDVDQTVHGNVDQTIHQNVTQEVDGYVSQTVHQNVTQEVDGNVNQTVHQNVTQQVDGNVTTSVDGDYTLDVGGNFNTSVTGSITRTGASIADDGGGATLDLAGSAALDGSRVDLG